MTTAIMSAITRFIILAAGVACAAWLPSPAQAVRLAMLSNHEQDAWDTAACANATARLRCNLLVYDRATAVAAQQGADMIVFPEVRRPPTRPHVVLCRLGRGARGEGRGSKGEG